IQHRRTRAANGECRAPLLATLEAVRSVRARFRLTPIASRAIRWLALHAEALTVALPTLRLHADASRRSNVGTRHSPFAARAKPSGIDARSLATPRSPQRGPRAANVTLFF